MKHIFLFILASVLCSCSNIDKKQNSPALTNRVTDDSIPVKNQDHPGDSVFYFSVDNYPVTDEMLQDKTSNNSIYLKQVDEVYSLEKVWFTNDRLKQTLVFQLYTDYHRMETYHFINDDIPKSIIEKIELSVAEGRSKNSFSPATTEQKTATFDNFIKLSERVNEKYFTTQKGIRLGINKEEIVKLYGHPDTTHSEEAFEIYKWYFTGEFSLTDDLPSTTMSAVEKSKIAKNSFGHTVSAYFIKNKLTAQIIENDIP